MFVDAVKVLIASVVIVGVSHIADRSPRLGAVLLTLPLVSILAFVATWYEQRNAAVVSRLARETLVLVPLGLPFFVPLAFSMRWGLGFWPAIGLSLVLAAALIAVWMTWGPKQL